MSSLPSGSWISERSDIAGYMPGKEWLVFDSENVLHVWKMLQPGGQPWICSFRLVQDEEGFQFYPVSNGTKKAQKDGWPISFEQLNDTELAVRHHGNITIFRRETTAAQPAATDNDPQLPVFE